MEGSRGSSSALCWCGCCELQLRPSLVPTDVHRGGRPPPQSYARVGSAGVWPGLGSGLPVSRQVTVHTSPLVFRYLLNRVKTILTYGYTQHPAQGPSTQYPAPSPGGSQYCTQHPAPSPGGVPVPSTQHPAQGGPGTPDLNTRCSTYLF